MISAALVIGGLCTIGGASAAGGSRHRPGHVSIPNGWRSYTYDHATISVPSNWKVWHDTNCTSAAHDVLVLGKPKAPYPCALLAASVSYAYVYTSTAKMPMGGLITVNGFPVSVSFGSPTEVTWALPTLGIDVAAAGPEASRILHTLRRS